jgi:cysteinyl-tRNA synthetase
MAERYLGLGFDLHGGGIDLCFPHHENEIAQSEAASGETFAHHWFHTAHLRVENQKMSKSLGNLYTLDDLEAKGYPPMLLRYLLLTGHYRQPFNFTFHGLDAAKSAIDKLIQKTAGLRPEKADTPAPDADAVQATLAAPTGPLVPALEALRHDLNTPKAIGLLFGALGELTPDDVPMLGALLAILGLNPQEALPKPDEAEAPPEVAALADERLAARAAKDFAKSDELRDRIAEAGWKILDRKDGYQLEPLG